MKIKVNTPICDHEHVVSTEEKDGEIKVDIDTSCQEVREDASGITLTKKELVGLDKDNSLISKIGDNLLYSETQCPVPAAIAMASRMEFGMITETKAKEPEYLTTMELIEED